MPGAARRLLALSGFRFGLSFHWTPINNVVIQVQVIELLGRQNQGKGIGLLFALGTLFAVSVPPLVGALSDRVRTPLGGRRTLMAAATLVDLVGLATMLTARSYPQLLAGYLIAQLASNGAGAAYAALIPDSVPSSDFGKISGFLATMAQIGQAASLLATVALARLGQLPPMYAVIGLVLVLSLVPSLVAGARRPPAADLAPPQPWRAQLVELVRPLTHGDFAWVFLTRLFVTCGINAVSPFLLLFFRDVARVPHPDQFTPLWLLTVLVCAIPLAIVGGILSDRLGRKRFIYGAGTLQGMVAIAFLAFYPTGQVLMLVMAAAYGVGYGLFAAVDSALALDTLPDRTRPAKDLGLLHVAEVLPGVFIPAAGGFLLDLLNRQAGGAGYRLIFGGAAIFFIAGGLVVRQVRSVR